MTYINLTFMDIYVDFEEHYAVDSRRSTEDTEEIRE